MLVFPKFLCSKLADVVIRSVLDMAFSPDSLIHELGLIKPAETMFHIKVMVLGKENDFPGTSLTPLTLTYYSAGHPSNWAYPFDRIADSKAQQLWEGKTDGAQVVPHLLFKGDTPYVGGVKREGIVVVCSGFDEYVDRMISGMIAEGLIAGARYLWEASDDKKNSVNFLT